MLLSKMLRTGMVTEPLDGDAARHVELARETLAEIRRLLGAPWPSVKWMPVRVMGVRSKLAD